MVVFVPLKLKLYTYTQPSEKVVISSWGGRHPRGLGVKYGGAEENRKKAKKRRKEERRREERKRERKGRKEHLYF